jgi:hypothetical protein
LCGRTKDLFDVVADKFNVKVKVMGVEERKTHEVLWQTMN